MNTYYCVTSAWYYDGHGTAAITDIVDAETAPESGYKSTRRKDIYVDWYDNYGDALAAVDAVRNA